MSGLRALNNIYRFTKYLGLIDSIPNIREVQKDIEYFVAIQNGVSFKIKNPKALGTVIIPTRRIAFTN